MWATKRMGVAVSLSVMALIGVLVFAVMNFHARSQSSSREHPAKNGTGQLIEAHPSQVDALGFAPEQDDIEGYSGTKWGTSITNFLGKSSNSPENQNNFVVSEDGRMSSDLATIFGVPDKTINIGGRAYQDIDYSDLPNKFQSVQKGDCYYIFFDGQLAIVDIALDPKNHEAISASLRSKYQELGTVRYKWGVASMRSSDLSATLFKRGNTNTRVYLLAGIDQETDEVCALYVVYVPTSFMWEIQHDIQILRNAHREEAAVAAQQAANAAWVAAQKAAKPDLLKLQ